MYKSIVFDLGGVMIDFDPKGYLVDRLCNAETEEEVYDLTFGSEEWKLLDAGLISRFDGNHRMLEKALSIVKTVMDKQKAEARPIKISGAKPAESLSHAKNTGDSSLRKAMGLPE